MEWKRLSAFLALIVLRTVWNVLNCQTFGHSVSVPAFILALFFHSFFYTIFLKPLLAALAPSTRKRRLAPPLECGTTEQEKRLHSSQIIPFHPAMAKMARILYFILEAAWSHRGSFYLKKYVRLWQEWNNYRFRLLEVANNFAHF